MNYNESRIYSISMTENELRLFSEFLSQKEFEKSKKSEEDKLRPMDKTSAKLYKLYPKGYREAMIEDLDEDSRNSIPLARKNAKLVAIGAPIATLGAAALASHVADFSSNDRKDLMALAVPVAAGAALSGAAGAYYNTKKEAHLRDLARDHSVGMEKEYQRKADLLKVANGEMTESEFAEKYYKKKDKEKK